MKDKVITLAHGDGGEVAHRLVKDIFVNSFSSSNGPMMDGAVLPFGSGKLVTSTDSFVVKPLFFPGGNIGKLAVCGTINDIAVMGAKPLYMTCGFIIEEGFSMKKLKEIVESMATEAKKNGVHIVSGDTKVVERGSCDGLFINTTGIGILKDELAPHEMKMGDVVIVSGTIGDHGISILAARNELGLMTNVESDCASLYPMIQSLREELKSIRIMRDPTRGGLATTLVEICEDFKVEITLQENKIPVRDGVHGACELFGFEPIYLANEGKLMLVVSEEECEQALKIIRRFTEGKDAALIGEISSCSGGKLRLKTVFGATRPLSRLASIMLPRIC